MNERNRAFSPHRAANRRAGVRDRAVNDPSVGRSANRSATGNAGVPVADRLAAGSSDGLFTARICGAFALFTARTTVRRPYILRLEKFGLALLFFLFPCLAGAQEAGFPLAPAQASSIAPTVDAVFYLIFALSVMIAGGVCSLIIAFGFVYRRGSKASRANAPAGNWKLEATWIAIPILLAAGVYAVSARVYFDEFSAPPGAIHISVVGKQWMWKIQHPEGQQELDELHVPIGRPVVLSLISQDVIHDFAVPAFRIRQDALPGRTTSCWFTATVPGRYHLFCSQYCGTQHSNMGGWVYAMEPADYERWLNESHNQPTLAVLGEKLFIQFGCSGCHGHSAAVRAPSLDGLYGSPVPLNNKTIVTADEQYIHDSITLPGKEIVGGYQNVMPSYQGVLSEEQISQLVAYIRSVGSEAARENGPPDNNQKALATEQVKRAGHMVGQPIAPQGTRENKPYQPNAYGGTSNRPVAPNANHQQDATQPNAYGGDKQSPPPKGDTSHIKGIQRKGNDMQQPKGDVRP